MSQQSNTTQRNTICSAEHPSNSCSSSASLWNLTGSSPGWLLQSPIRVLCSRSRHFPFPSLLQSCLFTESHNYTWYIIINISPILCNHMEVSAVTPPSFPTHHLGPHLQGKEKQRWFPSPGSWSGGVTPNPSGDPALLPSVTVPTGSTCLKATKQLLFVELGGEYRIQHELCTTQKGGC